MKKISILLSILLCVQLFPQVVVGNDTEYDNQNGPIDAYYKYSYKQIIYKANDINASGNITALTFEMANEDAIENSDNNIDLWIGHTTKTNFDSESDWVDTSTLNQVLTNGSLTKTGTTVTFTFSTPFEYNGSDNLIIVFDANEDGYDASSDKFYFSTDASNNNVCNYIRTDGENPDPFSPPAGTLTDTFPNITFIGIEQSCPSPHNLNAEDVTYQSANLNWTGNNEATTWNIEYGETGFSVGSGIRISDLSTNTYALSNLLSSTSYDFYVQSSCDNNDLSTWVGPFSFTTSCSPETLPYEITNFNNYPNCWIEAKGVIDALNYGISYWVEDRAYTNTNNEIINSASVNLFSVAHKEVLVTPNFDLNSTNYQLSVNVAVTDFMDEGTSAQTDSDNMGSDDEVILYISEDDGSTWSELTSWNKTNQPATTGTDYIIDLSAYTGMVKFAFYATDGYVNDPEDYDFHIGAFAIGTNLSVTSLSTNPSFAYYPNPVKDFLQIDSEEIIGIVKIYNINGVLILSQKVNTKKPKINTSKLEKGDYIVETIFKNDKKNTFKIIK